MSTPKINIFQFLKSSVWITVLVVRVGCIIEAHPSPNNSNGYKVAHNLQHHVLTTTELETAASHSILTSPKNSLGSISKKLVQVPAASLVPQQIIQNDGGAGVSISTKSLLETPPPTTTTTASTLFPSSSTFSPKTSSQRHQLEYYDQTPTSVDVKGRGEPVDDSCSGKKDGYYQNFGSGCASYYFCAAGYQITYVCPNGLKFNGKRCQKDYECPADGHIIINDCKEKSNGYYPNKRNLGKYFYCFQQAKVIELQCESGKVFLVDKCLPSAQVMSMMEGLPSQNLDGTRTTTTTCSKKSNGFYQDPKSNCEKYYYCIGGEKRELKCQEEYIFNGDICVHRSRYECPFKRATSAVSTTFSPASASAAGYGLSRKVKSGEERRSGRDLGTRGKLPIIAKTTSLENNGYLSTTIPENMDGTTMDPHLSVPNDV